VFLEIGNSAGFLGVKRTFPEIDAAALCKCEVSRMVTRCQIPRTKAPRITNVKKKGGRQNVTHLCILRCTGAHIDFLGP
jgi:hypothetical protein